MQHTQGTSSNSQKNLAALTEFFNSLIVDPGHDAESKFKEFIAIEFTSDGQHKYKLIDYFNNAELRKEIGIEIWERLVEILILLDYIELRGDQKHSDNSKKTKLPDEYYSFIQSIIPGILFYQSGTRLDEAREVTNCSLISVLILLFYKDINIFSQQSLHKDIMTHLPDYPPENHKYDRLSSWTNVLNLWKLALTMDVGKCRASAEHDSRQLSFKNSQISITVESDSKSFKRELLFLMSHLPYYLKSFVVPFYSNGSQRNNAVLSVLKKQRRLVPCRESAGSLRYCKYMAQNIPTSNTANQRRLMDIFAELIERYYGPAVTVKWEQRFDGAGEAVGGADAAGGAVGGADAAGGAVEVDCKGIELKNASCGGGGDGGGGGGGGESNDIPAYHAHPKKNCKIGIFHSQKPEPNNSSTSIELKRR